VANYNNFSKLLVGLHIKNNIAVNLEKSSFHHIKCTVFELLEQAEYDNILFTMYLITDNNRVNLCWL